MNRGRHSHLPSARPEILSARLRRDERPDKILEHRAPRRCPPRGTTKSLDIRFVVTSVETGSAKRIYETLYCARGQAENLIKLHKAQLTSDRHQLPQSAGQPDGANSAHCLLVDPHRPRHRCHSRVQHHPPAAFEARCPRYRDGRSCPPRFCRCLPGRHLNPPHRRGVDSRRAVNDGHVGRIMLGIKQEAILDRRRVSQTPDGASIDTVTFENYGNLFPSERRIRLPCSICSLGSSAD
jgi:Transposase DDE domain group 1